MLTSGATPHIPMELEIVSLLVNRDVGSISLQIPGLAHAAQFIDYASIDFITQSIIISSDQADEAKNVASFLSRGPQYNLMPARPEESTVLRDLFKMHTNLPPLKIES